MFPSCYYIADGERGGPFSHEELLGLAREGRISGETLVWSEDGVEAWQPLAIWSLQPLEAAGALPQEELEAVPPTSSAAQAASTWDRSVEAPSESPGGAMSKIADGADTAGQKLFRRLAGYSWWSIVISIGAKKLIDMLLAGQPDLRLRAVVISTSIWILTGLAAAIVALTGVRRHGRKGILVPALIGIGVWVIPIGLGIPQYITMRNLALAEAAAQPKISMKPLVSDPAAQRISGSNPDFSLEIPKNFSPLPADEKPADTLYAFTRPAGPPDLKDAFMVTVLPAMLSRTSLLAEEIPKGLTITKHNWRGVPLEGFRVELHGDGVDYVTIQVQVPLKRKAIQLGFGMPIAREAELLALIEKVLASLDGESNW